MKCNQLWCVIFWVISTASYASSAHQIKLNHINHEITQVRQTILKKTHQQSQLLNTLQSNEISIHHLSKKLHHRHQEMESKQAMLRQLKRQVALQQQALTQEKAAFAQQIRAAYLLKKTPYFKARLHGESPNENQRLLRYERAITQGCLVQFETIHRHLTQLQTTRTQIKKQTHSLKQLSQQLQIQRETLAQVNHHRRNTLIKISNLLQNKQKHLQVLISDKQSLQTLMRQLRAKQKLSKKYAHVFSSAQTHLRWPVRGKIIHHFSDKIAHSDLTWNAVVIRAKQGAQVHVIAPGKVIFAGWMPRYGLLTIVDHGKGYMSLYAHNQTLTQKKGGWVQPGDVIAKVGNTGGQLKPALYFGLWHNGKPINPETWYHQRKSKQTRRKT